MSSACERTLMADCGGLITDLGLALPTVFLAGTGIGAVGEGARLIAPISNLLSSLPAELHVHIFVDRMAFEGARQWLDGLNSICQTNLVPVGSDVSVIRSPWIQDRIHIRTERAQGRERTEVLARPNDVLASAIASHLAMGRASEGIFVPGGNQLVGQGFRLVGYSQTVPPGFRRDRSLDAWGLWRAISKMDGRDTSLFGYRIADLGQGRECEEGGTRGVRAQSHLQPNFSKRHNRHEDRIHQCGFHVDQYVSATGLFVDDRPLLLVADPISFDPDGERACQMLKRQLHASVLLLEEQGFAVQRNPVPLAVVADTGKRLPRLYNNVLLENALRPQRNRPQVWVPQFGDREPLEEFDSRNLAIWRRLGFDPIPVPGWSCLASRNGAIRCVTRVLRRDEPLQQEAS
ncbi:hypothetical protein [Rhizobium glycinendophyticum]|uniref:Uncharacterized protein n=1 Tax=Rhizobium glycinendophyticum TaxID=2589807 RepID=A0A504UKF2_9HYPH|nr:hypothetical protein [Rhizobium glycinendophyticum]TPP05862.1 hypothetical protein FJQ55_19165 [Rhizobium glycinendophyticum]